MTKAGAIAVTATGGRAFIPDTHHDNRPVERFRPPSQAEQDEEEMKDWVDGNARTYWPGPIDKKEHL